MRSTLELLTVLPRIEMELYGQAHPVVYGDSIIRDGNLSGLGGTFRPDSLPMLGLIQKVTLGFSWQCFSPE
jgi:hypothetical protein